MTDIVGMPHEYCLCALLCSVISQNMFLIVASYQVIDECGWVSGWVLACVVCACTWCVCLLTCLTYALIGVMYVDRCDGL